MTKINKRIEIIRSNIPDLSSMSTKSAAAACEILKNCYEDVGVSSINSLSDLKQLVALKPDLVFIGMKYVHDDITGKKIWVSGYLKKHGITHTGSPEKAVKYEQNKPFAKQCLIEAGVTTSPYMTVNSLADLNDAKLALTFPLFVKPSSLGAGKGVDEHSIVYNLDDLRAKVESLVDNYHGEVLIEKYLSGREFSVAVLKDLNSNELLAMPIEMHPGADSNGNHMLSFALKSGALETPVSTVKEGALKEQIKDLAINAFLTLGARDYGRIDIRLDEQGVPNFLEANLIPSIINNSGNFQKACLLNNGISYIEMLERIVNLAFARFETAECANESVNIATFFDPAAVIETR